MALGLQLRASKDRLEIMAESSWEEQGYIPMIGFLTLYLLALLITSFFFFKPANAFAFCFL